LCDKEERGAAFIVQLPRLQHTALSEPKAPTPDLAKSADPLSNRHILIVDDDDDTRIYQAFVLEDKGATVTAVASGDEALQAIAQAIPDLLISDIGMPEMDGYQLIQHIRARSPQQGGCIPAIALTAYATEVDQQKALQAGFQAHLTKPISPETLLETITSLFQ
jgi:CheY-like chemotaxis protein